MPPSTLPCCRDALQLLDDLPRYPLIHCQGRALSRFRLHPHQGRPAQSYGTIPCYVYCWNVRAQEEEKQKVEPATGTRSLCNEIVVVRSLSGVEWPCSSIMYPLELVSARGPRLNKIRSLTTL